MKDAFSCLNQLDVQYVLDAATGRGEFINTLKQNLRSYVQIIGVDSSEKTVNYTQKLFPENDVEIYRMDLTNLQFEDAYFDLVCISNSLHHMEHMDKVISELLRVLAPGGMLLITEMYQDGAQTDAQQTHTMMHHWIAGVDRKCGVYHRDTFTRDEIKAIVTGLHLDDVCIEDFYFPVDNPKETKNCENLKRNCLDTFKRLESIPDSQDLAEKGQQLLSRIADIGCASASRLLITGRKPKSN